MTDSVPGAVPGAAAEARPAATVLLLRPAEPGFEVFMVTRHHQIDFVAGALVFPGGKVEPADHAPVTQARCVGSVADGVDPALRVAAIRETFEESGLLLAEDRAGDGIAEARRAAIAERWRTPLTNGAATLADMLAAEDLRLRLDALVHFAHWVTPAQMPKRFDTHFFLARAPNGQAGSHDDGETVQSRWISPAQALADYAAKREAIVFPTRLNLMKLAAFGDVDAALDAARTATVPRIEPVVCERDGVAMLTIPDDAGYPISAVPLATAL